MLLKQLFEEIETREAADVWSEISSSSNTYMPNQIFQVRPSDDKRGMFDVFIDTNNRRSLHSSVSKSELDKTYDVIRPSDKPDGEGYIAYRLKDELEAAPYSGEPVNLTIGSSTVRLKKGDYLVRSAMGNDFTFSVEPKTFFNDTYTKV